MIQRLGSVFSQSPFSIVPPPPYLQYPNSLTFEVVTKIIMWSRFRPSHAHHYIARALAGRSLACKCSNRYLLLKKQVSRYFVAYFLKSLLLTTPPMTTCPTCNPAPTTKPLQATGSTHRRRATHSLALSASTDCRLCRCSSSSAIASQLIKVVDPQQRSCHVTGAGHI